MKLKLTNREKKLLAILGICLIAAILYCAVIKPQLDMVSRLEKNAKEYSIIIESMKQKASPDNPAYKEYDELYNKTEDLLKSFFPDIIQEKIILLLEGKIEEAKIDAKILTFTEPGLVEAQLQKAEQPKQTNELEELTEALNNGVMAAEEKKVDAATAKGSPLMVEKMTVTMEYTGTYSQIYSFIKSIEQESRSIAFSSLTINSVNGGLLNGEVTMDFYSIPKPVAQDEDYLNWDITGSYGKENPFDGMKSIPAKEEAVTKSTNINP